MTVGEQRAAFAAIGLGLNAIALHEPLDWKAARRLHVALGKALRTDAQKARRRRKRQRYLDNRAIRRAQRDAT